MRKTKLTWSDVSKLVDKIATEIKESNLHLTRFKAIYGVPRGGLIVAVILSHRLSLPLTNVISSDTLVVDDISDSGGTLQGLEDGIRNGFYSATLVVKTKSTYWPDFTGKLLTTKDWIVFPWENDKSSKKDNTIKNGKNRSSKTNAPSNRRKS